MQTKKALYFSKGIPKKAKKISHVSSRVVVALGVLMLLLPLISDAPSMFVYLGVLYIGCGILIPRTYNFHNRGKLVVLEECVKGVAIGVFNSSGNNFSIEELGKMIHTQTTPFQLQYDQISDVKRGGLYILTISSGDRNYNVPVQDKETAYNIICDKVYGEACANSCVRCGAAISATTKECPQCGHTTRFGKVNSETSSKQRTVQSDQIKTLIGIAVGIIGLFIFLPALIKLNEVSKYGELYTAFHPAESKQLLFKVIAGFFLTVFGFSYPISNKLVNKLQGK